MKKQALSFSNPMVPYKWDDQHAALDGSYCIFNPHFFVDFPDIQKYEVFQPHGTHVFELNDEEANYVQKTLDRMKCEMESDYKYKYDLIRNLIMELVHFGMKLHPAEVQTARHGNASLRIASLFLELLERQFPIDDIHAQMQLRTASDFAEQLNVHVNHLNRAVKEMTNKTTTQLISERLLQEAKILLHQSRWNVSEIAMALGFAEVPHFNLFFKKHQRQTPTQFRHGLATDSPRMKMEEFL